MSNVVVFPSGAAHVPATQTTSTVLAPLTQVAPEVESSFELDEFDNDPYGFMLQMRDQLSSEDYQDFLEGIVSYESFLNCDPDIQRIVTGYFERR